MPTPPALIRPVGNSPTTPPCTTPDGPSAVQAFLDAPSLEHRETSEHDHPRHVDWYVLHRHRGDSIHRNAVRTGLINTSAPYRIITRFNECGQNAWLLQHKTRPDLVKISCTRCRHRLCPACARERGFIVRKNLDFLAKTANVRLKLITLTTVQVHTSLRDRLNHLQESFKQLRRLELWKRNVRAGAAIIEIKVAKSGDWNVHLHILVDADYIPQPLLCAAWKACTGGAYITDIRPISTSNGVGYVTKYVSKPLDQTVVTNPHRLEEYMLAIKGRRLIAGLGRWRNCPLARTVAEEIDLTAGVDTSPENWNPIATIANIYKAARAGDPMAITLLEAVHLLDKEQRCTSPPPS